jgi:hypothetical protein
MTAQNPARVKTQPSLEVVNVTPKLAELWLGKNHRNRNIRNRIVLAYARDMEAGHWQLTGEAIKFDVDGNLIDGQHRLSAIVRAGITVPMVVCTGLSASAQNVVDTGTRRLASDTLQLDGYRNSTVLASAARLAMAYEDGLLDNAGRATRVVTTSEIKSYVDAHPQLAEAVDGLQSMRNRLDLTLSVTCVCWYVLAQLDGEACAEFFATLANAQTNGPGDPRNALLRRLASARRGNERLSSATQMSLVFRAWNAWRRTQTLESLPIASRLGDVRIPKPI